MRRETPDLAGARQVDEGAARAARSPAVTRGPLPASGVLRHLDDDLLPFLDEVVDARPLRAVGGLAGRRRPPSSSPKSTSAGARRDVLDVEERIAVQTDRHERRLHPGQHAVHAAEVHVADEALPAAPLVEHLDDAAVLGAARRASREASR